MKQTLVFSMMVVLAASSPLAKASGEDAKTNLVYCEKTLPIITPAGVENIIFSLNENRVFQDYAFCVKEETHHWPYLCIWSPRRLYNLSLIASAGKGYMAWVDGSMLCLSELVKASPKCIYEPMAGLPSAAQADHAIDLSCFQGSDSRFGLNDRHFELKVISMTKDVGSDLSILATNLMGKQFRFAKGKDMWRAFDERGEIERIRPANHFSENVFPTTNGDVLFSGNLLLADENGIHTNIGVQFIVKMYGFHLGSDCFGRYLMIAPEENDLVLAHEAWIRIKSGQQPGNARIVALRPGSDNYLAFTDGRGKLILNKLSPTLKPSRDYVDDPEVGVLSTPNEDPNFRGKMDYIIDLQQFDNWQRFFKGGGGVTSANEQNAVLTLSVTNAAGTKFTFSNQEGQWHAYTFWGEINRNKTK